MYVIGRIRGIVSAHVNDLADRFAEPELMLRQAIREMDAALGEATAGAAQVIASKTLLLRQRGEHDRQARLWQARAEAAVAAGDDARARKALARRFHHERLAASAAEQAAAATEASERLCRQVETMRTQLAEARGQLTTLIARRRAAAAAARLPRRHSIDSPALAAFEPFATLRAEVERAEAEADALRELDAGGLAAEDDLAAQEQRERIEAALAQLKAGRTAPT
jgi:phage shock protein A